MQLSSIERQDSYAQFLATKELLQRPPTGAQTATEVSPVLLGQALFYLDLMCLQELGRNLTGLDYLAVDTGPFPDFLPKLPPNRPSEFTLKVEFQFPQEQLELVLKVQGWMKSGVWTGPDIHENLGWKTAHEKQPGSKINMVLAMQQLLDDDLWMEEDQLSEEEESVFRSAVGDEGTPW